MRQSHKNNFHKHHGKIFTYVSKSISYKVSEKGTLTGLHILDEAASVGCAGTPSIPVADAKALAATVDPV